MKSAGINNSTDVNGFAFRLFILFLLVSGNCFSQDTVAQGIIKVRRGPVSTVYRLSLDYHYHPARRFHLFHRLYRPVDSSKVIINPPEPVSVVHRNDSINPRNDSVAMKEFFKKEDRPLDGFTWTEWLHQYQHYMVWDDTAGIDSAAFIYTINTNGTVQFKPGADNGLDSSSTALQKQLTPYMRKLWMWYPASTVDDSGKRRKNLSCTVTVKVYAIRKDKENLPLKIAD